MKKIDLLSQKQVSTQIIKMQFNEKNQKWLENKSGRKSSFYIRENKFILKIRGST